MFAAIALRYIWKGDDRLVAKLNIACLFAPLAGIATWSVQRLLRRSWSWYTEGFAILFLTPVLILVTLEAGRLLGV